MAINAATKLPPPPPDMATRTLPVRRLKALFRIHRSDHACWYFSKNGSGRFDDPRRKYGVLDAALKPEAAFAEVFLRPLSQMILRESDVEQRTLSEIGCQSVVCVDLTGAGLRQLACDNRLATEKPDRTTGLWSRAIFEHPQKPAGIIYLSRHNPQFKCVALFDRCLDGLCVNRVQPLMRGPRRAWTFDQISRYHLALQP